MQFNHGITKCVYISCVYVIFPGRTRTHLSNKQQHQQHKVKSKIICYGKQVILRLLLEVMIKQYIYFIGSEWHYQALNKYFHFKTKSCQMKRTFPGGNQIQVGTISWCMWNQRLKFLSTDDDTGG